QDPCVAEEEDDEPLIPPADWRPKRLVRTVLSSMASSKEFGRQMAREAKRRRFGEAQAKAFLGDGLPWNWSIWKEHFSDYVPILDFIHVLSYLIRRRQGDSRRSSGRLGPVPRLDDRLLAGRSRPSARR